MGHRGVLVAIGMMVAAISISIAINQMSPKAGKFASYSEVVSSDLLAKGWLPTYLPLDAYDIVEQHDLDTGESVVEFSYETELWLDKVALRMHDVGPQIKSKLKREVDKIGWNFRDENGTKFFQSKESGELEFLAVNPKQRRALYWRDLDRKLD